MHHPTQTLASCCKSHRCKMQVDKFTACKGKCNQSIGITAREQAPLQQLHSAASAPSAAAVHTAAGLPPLELDDAAAPPPSAACDAASELPLPAACCHCCHCRLPRPLQLPAVVAPAEQPAATWLLTPQTAAAAAAALTQKQAAVAGEWEVQVNLSRPHSETT